MNTVPCVSVIIPVYNTEKYLRECIDSVVNQTLKDIEIICVDDGSTDGSLGILREYEAEDTRVKVLTQSHKDAGAARNLGLKYAKGEYLSFLDSDDFFDINMLLHGYQKAKKVDADILICAVTEYNMKTGEKFLIHHCLKMELCPKTDPFPPDSINEQIFQLSRNVVWNKIFKRTFINQNDISFQEVARANDTYFACVSMALASRITVLDESLVTYRTGTGTSLQQTNFKEPTAFWDAFVGTKKGLESYGVYDKYEKSFVNRVLDGIIYNMKTLKGTDSFSVARNLIAVNGNYEFKFFDHTLDYYYNRGNIYQYISLFGDNLTKDIVKQSVSQSQRRHSLIRRVIAKLKG